MFLLWATLFFLHQGYTLVPVVTVQHGDPVNLTCVLPDDMQTTRGIYWYKQNAGDTLRLIAMLKKNVNPVYGTEFSSSRVKTTHNGKCSNLTILSTIEDDEGMYHCSFIDWTDNTWSGTYLSLKGNSEKTLDYTVVQHPKVSDPARQEVTLQCSVLSESENKSCSEDLHAFWFRSHTSHKSLPDIIYADGSRHNECVKKSQTQDRCVYSFSRNISSSDDGTYYCAVATCGEILFGKRNKPDVQEQKSSFYFPVLVITIICLVISMTGNIVLICYKPPWAGCGQFKRMETTFSQRRQEKLNQTGDDFTEGGHDLNYAALHFTGGQTTRGKKKGEFRTEESVYSQVKC